MLLHSEHQAAVSPGIRALRSVDSSAAFVRDGYTFGQRRFRELKTDAFRTRLLGRPATVVYGADAARVFYDGDRFGRDRAMPASMSRLLFDDGSIQMLSGAAHRHRKHLFLRLLADAAQVQHMRALFAEEWLAAAAGWRAPIVLLDELAVILTRVALRWTGLDVNSVDARALAGELSAMVNNAGRMGVHNWMARSLRHRTEEWAKQVIIDVRTGQSEPDASSVVARVAEFSNENGARLSVNDAAIELINLLRPIVAVGRFIVFAAVALHRHPRWRDSFAAHHWDDLENFVQEVRRFYPFFPVIGGRALHPFDWHGEVFIPGDWVLLDLYATNHDERIWIEPGRFRPERFRDWDGDRYSLIPQGAGDLANGHRCPGERATIELMKEAVVQLVQGDAFTVPPQDLRISLRRFPAKPESGFVLLLASGPFRSPYSRG